MHAGSSLALDDWLRDLSAPDDVLIMQHRRALNNIEVEGVESMEYEGKLFQNIATCYAALGRVEEFTYWARRIALAVPEGPWPQWADTPQVMPMWGRRSQKKHSRN